MSLSVKNKSLISSGPRKKKLENNKTKELVLKITIILARLSL